MVTVPIYYEEKRKSRFTYMLFFFGLLVAVLFLAIAFFIPAPEGAEFNDIPLVVGKTLYEQAPGEAILFGVFAGPLGCLIFIMMSLVTIVIVRVSRDEVFVQTGFPDFIPIGKMTFPIESIVDMVETPFSQFSAELEESGVLNKVLTLRMNKQIVYVNGNTPLKVFRHLSNETGVVFTLSDGVRIFVGSRNPDALMTAVRSVLPA